MIKKMLIILCVVAVNLCAQEIIDISVKGISNSKNDGAQIDRQEAIMDAKRQACEKSGVRLQSQTNVENFQVTFDYIESKAEAVLMPGFNIIDIGYTADGTYQVVLAGKVKVVNENDQDEHISAKELRYAKTLHDNGELTESSKLLEKYINSEDEKVSEALKEEAHYLYIKWGYSFDTERDVEKYAAFYPESDKIDVLRQFAEFARNKQLEYNKTFAIEDENWQVTETTIDKEQYQKKKNIVSETLMVKDFRFTPYEVLLEFDIYQKEDTDEQNPAAYTFKLSYKDGDEVKVIENREKALRKNNAMTFQHSSSGKRFKYFSFKGYTIKGDIPLDKDQYNISIRFDVFPRSF
jgi:hypothetical protein